MGRLRKSLDAAGGTTLYAWTNDLLTSITDPNGNVTSYQYDALKRLQKTVFPDGATETYRVLCRRLAPDERRVGLEEG